MPYSTFRGKNLKGRGTRKILLSFFSPIVLGVSKYHCFFVVVEVVLKKNGSAFCLLNIPSSCDINWEESLVTSEKEPVS